MGNPSLRPAILRPANALVPYYSDVAQYYEYDHSAHVPYGIGEINADYIFGLPTDEGWTAIWSFENGLLLYSRVEQAMDAAQLVINPDEDSGEGLKVVILDEARPLKRYLYFLCLISLFRRHRFYVEGSERDQAKLQMGKIWGSPGSWM